MRYYTPKITLIDKTTSDVTAITIDGDTTGDLIPHRVSGRYVDVIGEKIKHGTLTLRSIGGKLFIKDAPILVDDNTRDKYLIDVQLFQPNANFSNEVGEVGTHFRFEIADSHIVDDKSGIHVALNLQGWERRLSEVLDSDAHRLYTPKKSFLKRLQCYSLFKGSEAPLFFVVDTGDTAVNLPDTTNLKQDFIPAKPTPIKTLIDDIIKKISKPEYIGTVNEDYYYYFITNPTKTKSFKVVAGPLGNIDSGVVVDEVESASGVVVSKERNTMYDNTEYKNTIVVKAKRGSHSLPMDFTKFASDWTHAVISDSWAAATAYKKGDYAKHGNKFYKCKAANTADAGNAPGISTIIWENLSNSTRGTPWTLNVDCWKANMSNYANPPTGYVGLFNDFNIVQENYDKADETDEYETVSLKDVEDFLTTPADIPTGAMQHARRWLVNGNAAGTAWAGHSNQIAQYDESVSPSVWHFSVDPVTDDMVTLLSLARVLRFDGTVWDTAWNVSTNPEVSSPFHLVKSVKLVKDYRDVTNKAVEFYFDWNAIEINNGIDEFFAFLGAFFGSERFQLAGQALNTLIASASDLLALGITKQNLQNNIGTGDVKNKSARWCGYSFKVPFPRYTVGSQTIGKYITEPFLDFDNLTTTIRGKSGWNNGKLSEDFGAISGIEQWVKVSFENKKNQLITGMANMSFIYWYRDIFNRIVYGEKVIPLNGFWKKIRLEAGYGSNLKLLDSRINELFKLYGYVFPHNHFLKERELTGVRFDWNHVKEMGFFYKGSYDINNFYVGAQDTWFDFFTQHTSQVLANTALYSGGLIDIAQVVVDHAKLAITDFHFIKDAYVINNASENDDSRQIMVSATDESDYNNLVSLTAKTRARLEFQPERHILETRGNVKIKPGHKFLRKNSSIPGGEQELVAIQCEHIESSKGYNTVITGVKKFVVNP